MDMKDFALFLRLQDKNDFVSSLAQVSERANWLKAIEKEEKLVYQGTILPFAQSEAKTVFENEIVTPGPFVEVKEFISGFMIIKSKNIEEAIEIAKRNPIFKLGGSIEVREIKQME